MPETRVMLRAIYSKVLEATGVEEIRVYMRSIMNPEDVAIVERNKKSVCGR